MGNRLIAIGSTALVAALDADQHQAVHDGVHVRYEIDNVTGLAMAPDRVMPHMGVVMSCGARVEGVETMDRIVLQRAGEGHPDTFLWCVPCAGAVSSRCGADRCGARRWQVIDCEDDTAVPGFWTEGRFEAGPGRMLITPDGPDRYDLGIESSDVLRGAVTSSDIEGINAGDRVWWLPFAGVSWTAEGAEYVSLSEDDALCVETGS